MTRGPPPPPSRRLLCRGLFRAAISRIRQLTDIQCMPWLVSWPAVLENLLRWVLEVSGRPSVAEAVRVIGPSLFGRSAPRPLLPSRGRICGRRRLTASLRLQARLERAQGRGAEASAYQRRLP